MGDRPLLGLLEHGGDVALPRVSNLEKNLPGEEDNLWLLSGQIFF